jgi:hypothetical protein
MFGMFTLPVRNVNSLRRDLDVVSWTKVNDAGHGGIAKRGKLVPKRTRITRID